MTKRENELKQLRYAIEQLALGLYRSSTDEPLTSYAREALEALGVRTRPDSRLAPNNGPNPMMRP